MPDKKAPEPRKFEKPVSWLLGRQLIASLKSTLLYTAFGTKIDARDWMDAKVFPQVKNNHEGKDLITDAWKTMYEREKPAGESRAATSATDSPIDKGEFWFDYISDTGDGMTATYSVAYLCLSDVWVADPGTAMPANKLPVKLRPRDDVTGLEKLPRGEFLLVGGDTSYHMADYASLHQRFQLPFQWAYDDLRKAQGKKSIEEMTDLEKQEEKKKQLKHLRPIFGIPGNHDYYDMLDGFRRQFREPPRSRSEKQFFANESDSSQLQIPGFRRYQETSYIALRLPFDWMIWGLDTEVGKIDERQRDFFRAVKEACNPKKLIVCTSAPTTVFGKFADKNDEKSAKAFLQLDLARPFLKSVNLPATNEKEAAEKAEDQKERQLQDDEIRLDLAGDVHHYARYWGPSSPQTQPTRHYASDKQPLQRTNYASVMSGLGGAFHHPSTTYVDEIREQALYPNEDDSRKHVAREIFNPWRVVKGGGVWFVGGLVALVLAFAAIAGLSSRAAIHNLPLFLWTGITQEEFYEPTITSLAEAKRKQDELGPSVFSNLGLTSTTWEREPKDPACTQNATTPVYLWGKCRVLWPWEYFWGFWMVLLTVPAMIVAFLLMRRHYRAWKEREEIEASARKASQTDVAPRKFDNDVHVKKVNWTIWGFTIGTALLAFVSVLLMMPYRNFITPFGNSLLVLLSICWAGFAIYLSLKYSDWLFEQASKRQIRRRDWAITWVLTACAFFALAIGLWIFGKNNLAAYLVADIVFVLFLLAIPLLLIYVGWSMGGANQKGIGKFGMGVLGFWHGLLQIGVAVFLIKKGTWLTVMLGVVLILIFWRIGRTLMNENRRGWLTFAWLVFGAIMLALPPLVYDGLIEYGPRFFSLDTLNFFFSPQPFNQALPFSQYEWWSQNGGWWRLIPILIAGVFGAFLSCIWLGWYLAVCLGFHGHNNEAGGAARIEKFKQLIRFRLTKDSLTGYVIAVDEPKRNGQEMYPDIIDVFHLTRKGST